MSSGRGVNVTELSRRQPRTEGGEAQASPGRADDPTCAPPRTITPPGLLLTGHRLVQAIAKRRDEQLLRMAVERGLLPPADLHHGLAQLHLDGRPVLGGRSSYRVLLDLVHAMARDGLTIPTAR